MPKGRSIASLSVQTLNLDPRWLLCFFLWLGGACFNCNSFNLVYLPVNSLHRLDTERGVDDALQLQQLDSALFISKTVTQCQVSRTKDIFHVCLIQFVDIFTQQRDHVVAESIEKYPIVLVVGRPGHEVICVVHPTKCAFDLWQALYVNLYVHRHGRYSRLFDNQFGSLPYIINSIFLLLLTIMSFSRCFSIWRFGFFVLSVPTFWKELMPMLGLDQELPHLDEDILQEHTTLSQLIKFLHESAHFFVRSSSRRPLIHRCG